MGFMDKVKAQAEVAVAKAQQGVAQGQSKIDDYQGKRVSDSLLLALGHAFYAEQRTGGATADVAAALGAVDAHVAANGPIASPAADAGLMNTPGAAAPSAPGAPAAPAPGAAAPAANPPAAPAAPAEGASFSLDDL
jgi:hypothetical protein